MPFIGIILGLFLRSLGRILAFLFGWAIIRFFGKMPAAKQYLLSGIALFSLLWWFLLLSWAWPPLFGMVGRLQPQVARESGWLALVTWPGIIGLPPLVGLLSLFVDEEPPRGWWPKLKQLLQGYLIAPGFGVAIFLMVLVGTWLVAYKYLRQLRMEHIPITIRRGGYDTVLHDLAAALRQSGYQIEERPLPWLLRPPVWVLSKFAGAILQGITPQEPRMLQGDRYHLAIIVHPTDIAITAAGTTAMRARAIITTNVPFTAAYLTWSKEARAFEDRIAALRDRYAGRGMNGLPESLAAITSLKEEIYLTGISFEEWEVIYREVLQLQEALVVTPVEDAGIRPSRDSP